MKKVIKKLKTIGFVALLDSILEHKLFKPVTISIITTFILVNGLKLVQGVIVSHKGLASFKNQLLPIKVNISESGSGFDINKEQIINYQIKPGDTVLKVLLNIGVKETDAFAILEEMKKIYDPKSISNKDVISIGYETKISYDAASNESINREVIIKNILISPSVDRQIMVERENDGKYKAKEIKLKIVKSVSRYYGTIENGLYIDAVKSGISPTAVMNMINLYSYDVDFQRDVQDGDKFEILVESYYTEDGRKVKDGNILFSSLTLNNKPIDIYMYEVSGKPEYFDSKGNSTRKSLLRTPINGARVSSSFGMRKHPVLGYSKMHKGIDFAAPSGTPILAAGSGTITYYSVKGGYGNFVQIKHNQEYSTAYGHASRFVKKFRVGSKVKQGEVVAYVGSTGRSTGPHLHFELLYKGTAVNPSKVKATSGLKLAGKALKAFEAVKAEVDRHRKNIPNHGKK